MTQTTDPALIVRFPENLYPLIEQGAPPPGRWVDRADGSRHWIESHGWRTRHGEAIVVWSFKRPIFVVNARLSDGSRADIGSASDYGFRRHLPGERQWTYGTLDIQPGDVIFQVSDKQPVYQPEPHDKPSLEADMAHDAAFCAAMRDERFARAAFGRCGWDHRWPAWPARKLRGLEAFGPSATRCLSR
jgi:hypothetical protein